MPNKQELKEIADRVRAAVGRLNQAIEAAADAGLNIDVNAPIQSAIGHEDRPLVLVEIKKVERY